MCLALFLATTSVSVESSFSAESTQPAMPALPGTGIDALELKLFEHTYIKDSLSHRIERIERMVFGEPRTGSESERLETLVTLVPASKPAQTATISSATAKRQKPPSDSAAQSSDYPSITALESQILRSTFRNDPIRTRLDRLEAKAYGKPGNGSDLSLRVSELQKYARANGLAPEAATPFVTKYVPPPATTASLDAKVTWLEEQVYGRSVPDRSIFDRVRRLNQSVLPKDYLEFDGSIPENVNTLLSAVELDQADRLVDGEPKYKPLPENVPGGFRTTASKARLNNTASILQDIGMPSPLRDIGAETAGPGSVEPSSDDTVKPKKKRRGSAFWSALKEAITESDADDLMGIPRYAYGGDPFTP